MSVLPLGASGGAVAQGQAADPPITYWEPPDGSIGHLLVQTATISHVDDDAQDGYGNPTKAVTAIDVAPCYLGPVQETEYLVEAETYVTFYRLILGPGVPLDAHDLVAIGSSSYAVHEALHFIHPRTGIEHHVEAKITSEEG